MWSGFYIGFAVRLVNLTLFLNMQVVGVAQIINKMPGPVPFTEEDEEVISA